MQNNSIFRIISLFNNDDNIIYATSVVAIKFTFHKSGQIINTTYGYLDIEIKRKKALE